MLIAVFKVRSNRPFLTNFLSIESTIWRQKSVAIKRAAKTIMLRSCNVENCEDTSATMVEPESRRNLDESVTVFYVITR